MSEIKNVLASRYASESIRGIFSERGRILTEREFWIAVLRAQRELGLDIPPSAIDAYEKVKEDIDLAKIRRRERKLRHDVKARIEIFCELAGFEHIHMGMTSRDLTDNVEQSQVLSALKIIRLKSIRVLQLMTLRAREYRDLVMAGRTHNVPAQPVTFGKRIAMTGQEIMLALQNLESIIETYPLRGLKGAVGTLLDQMTLFKGNPEKVRTLEERVARHLGFDRVFNAVGQVYPRSLDFQVITALFQLAAGPANFCKTLRLMAGQGLANEGFSTGQVGSSAMPHKMNTRNSERVSGLAGILKGHVTMAASISGDQWMEGDVSCSVVRRVVIPDAFFALDGLLETYMTILLEMNPLRAAISRELREFLPFLSTTTLLMAAVQKGQGREKAHEIIRKHATDTVEDLRENRIPRNDLLERLDRDPDFPLSITELKNLLKNPRVFAGLAEEQVQNFDKQVQKWVKKYPQAARIKPGRIL